MKKVDFLALVLANVIAVKNNATAEEKENLGVISRPMSRVHCLFGQLTGDSDSVRANEICEKTILCSSEKYYELEQKGIELQKGDGLGVRFFQSSPRFTEAYLETVYLKDETTTNETSSAVELFILMDGANTDEMVDFIKGKREEFTPRFGETNILNQNLEDCRLN